MRAVRPFCFLGVFCTQRNPTCIISPADIHAHTAVSVLYVFGSHTQQRAHFQMVAKQKVAKVAKKEKQINAEEIKCCTPPLCAVGGITRHTHQACGGHCSCGKHDVGSMMWETMHGIWEGMHSHTTDTAWYARGTPSNALLAMPPLEQGQSSIRALPLASGSPLQCTIPGSPAIQCQCQCHTTTTTATVNANTCRFLKKRTCRFLKKNTHTPE